LITEVGNLFLFSLTFNIKNIQKYMGDLREKIKENIEKNSGLSNYFKKNSLEFYELYNNPDNKIIKPVNIAKMGIGGIYFIYYKDESNWMRYSPILMTDHRDNRLLFGVNLNFLPLEQRTNLFESIIEDINDENNKQPTNTKPFQFITFETIYKKLIRFGFEYSLVEYSLDRIAGAFEISFTYLDKWIYSNHPNNIYDPIKLYDIWSKKLKNRPERHKEMITRLVEDFYNITDDLIEESQALQDHLKRLKRNQEKYGSR